MHRKWYGNSFRLGMVGGGQLGRMFIQEAINFDVQVHSLDPDPEAPCKTIATSFTVGSLNEYETLYNFGLDKDVITVEIENVNIEALERLEAEGKKVFPQPRILKIIQDKGLQKQFYLDNNIPTAPFELVENKAEINSHLTSFPFMQKLRKGGYDGKGVQPLRNNEDLEYAFDAPSVLEKMIPFVKELSIIVARNEDGQTAVYPAVECEFNPEANLVEFLFSPAEITNDIEERSKKIAVDVINKLGMVGLLAVELFLLENGKILVNEIAPRPHNSGHHTIECNVTSQYEQHMRSVLNLPLGSTNLVQSGVMINLLGEKGFEGDVYYENYEEALSLEGVKIHIYGKQKTKSFRKMGHVTVGNSSLDKAKEIARKVQEILKVKA
jgi:5-(carboxyamino)imidazole ribonucleotide synthase